MALCKRSNTWWIDISHNGQRIRISSGTTEKIKAQQLHDKLKAELWLKTKLGQSVDKNWKEGAIRWMKEQAHKKSIRDDVRHLEWLKPYLEKLTLSQITRDVIDHITTEKLKTGVKNSSVNRMLEILRALLRRAERDWGWLEKAPIVRMLHSANKRIRWITKEEAAQLLEKLPQHLRDICQFALATGLRKANILTLEWLQVDLSRNHALVHADQSKTAKPIAVPLNESAIQVLQRRLGTHPKYVFTYNKKPINECNTKVFRKALKDCKIVNFRWHDLRHTWASWHIQSGTSLQELQQLGGWSSFVMVLRYAHLSSEHLTNAARRIDDTILSQEAKEEKINN